jgi:phage shock protein A
MNAQIERLQKDSSELEIYAKKLAKKGEENRAQKILKKRNYIEQQIANLHGPKLRTLL